MQFQHGVLITLATCERMKALSEIPDSGCIPLDFKGQVKHVIFDNTGHVR